MFLYAATNHISSVYLQLQAKCAMPEMVNYSQMKYSFYKYYAGAVCMLGRVDHAQSKKKQKKKQATQGQR